MKNISKNISYKEATYSNTAIKKGIDNTPNDTQLCVMETTAEKIFQLVRDHFGVPIYISSFFRSKKLNGAVKGSKTSDHMNGEAIDMDADVFGKITNAQIFHFIKDYLEFNQLIWEYGDDENPNWVHASYVEGNNKNEILVVKRVNGKSIYTLY